MTLTWPDINIEPDLNILKMYPHNKMKKIIRQGFLNLEQEQDRQTNIGDWTY